MGRTMHLAAAAGLALLAVAEAAGEAAAGDFLVTAARPNNLFLIDLATRQVVSDCPLPDEFGPGVIVLSPDKRPGHTVAYILNHRWENVYGVDVDSCEIVFTARQSQDDERVKSIASLAVSPDGRELYTVQNPTRLGRDRFEVLAPRFAVYDTAAGLDARPLRSFPAPRRLTVMATGADGTVYAGGHDIYAIDPDSGAVEVAIANAGWDRPRYSPPDVLAFWPIGSQANEFLLMYTAAVFTDDSYSELADYVWGASRVDLASGATEIADFASFEVIMFSAVTDPQDRDTLYGVYTQLSKHDLAGKRLIKRVDLDHTYYCINISSDGRELYVGGTNNDIAIYDAGTLEKTGEIRLPGGGDMGTATLQVFRR